jgi:hypothetical protein
MQARVDIKMLSVGVGENDPSVFLGAVNVDGADVQSVNFAGSGAHTLFDGTLCLRG